MSPSCPTPFQPKRETNDFCCPSSLKISKDSHFIKKAPPSTPPSSSSSSSLSCMATLGPRPQQRRPVIIYTHSPKIIHTHPRDFMALVQKLTGYTRPNDDHGPKPKSKPGNDASEDETNRNANPKPIISDDNESTSVVTDENGSSSTATVGDGQVNSCFVPPPIFDPPNPCFNIPLFAPDFVPFYNYNYNYNDSLFFMPNMRSSISSSPLEAMKEFPEF
ncbi:hypothetical protein RJ640_011761 [Escallonia rubra]|uniref:VQ domain-containing protein n=1 Tax=Escallonia rubra TaxID=112253 RepID=A0AA88QPK1_9ASTE|nr:hypothetical protein RJ640_011761 [Escallonia rubra]